MPLSTFIKNFAPIFNFLLKMKTYENSLSNCEDLFGSATVLLSSFQPQRIGYAFKFIRELGKCMVNETGAKATGLLFLTESG